MSQEPNKRRIPPKVEAKQDLPLKDGGMVPASPGKSLSKRDSEKTTTPRVAEPQNFRQMQEYRKLQFAQKVVGWCIFLIVVLVLIDHFTANEDSALNTAIELLKVVTTTALGYVFAQSQHVKKDDE